MDLSTPVPPPTALHHLTVLVIASGSMDESVEDSSLRMAPVPAPQTKADQARTGIMVALDELSRQRHPQNHAATVWMGSTAATIFTNVAYAVTHQTVDFPRFPNIFPEGIGQEIVKRAFKFGVEKGRWHLNQRRIECPDLSADGRVLVVVADPAIIDESAVALADQARGNSGCTGIDLVIIDRPKQPSDLLKAFVAEGKITFATSARHVSDAVNQSNGLLGNRRAFVPSSSPLFM